MTYTNNANDTAVQAGWSLGDYGIITENDEGCHHDFETGDVVQLAKLDGSSCPLFVRLCDGRTQYVDIVDGVGRVSTSLPRVFYTRCYQSSRTRLKKSPALQSLGKWLNGQDFADSDIGYGEIDCGWLQFDGKVWHGGEGDTPYPDAGAVAIDLEELEDWAAVVDAQAEYGSAYQAKIKEEEELKTPAAAAGIFVGTECVLVRATPRYGLHAGDIVTLNHDDTSSMPEFEVPLPCGTLYLLLKDVKPKAECSPAELGGYVKGVRCVVIEEDGEFEQGTIVTLARDDGSECPRFESVDNPEDQHYLVLGYDVVLERLYEAPKTHTTPCQALGIVQGAVCFLKGDHVNGNGTTVLKRGDVVVVTLDDNTQRPYCKVLVDANGKERPVFPYVHQLQPTGLILEQYAAKK